MTCACGGMCDGTGCGGGPPRTPYPVDNPPGQPSLSARIGTFASFRRTLLEALGTRPELAELTTRDSDDAAVSLVEQAAAVADVLTYYTERYANESYLGTAVLDADMRRLVGLIGYHPAPGLSATTTLCLTLDDGAAFTVPAGFGVQSVPGPEPGDTPQDFETLTGLAADYRLNALPARPAQTAVDPLSRTEGAVVYPPGAAPLARAVSAGDPIALVRAGSPSESVITRLAAVTVDRERVRLGFAARLPGTGGRAFRVRRFLRLFGSSAPETGPPVAKPDSTDPDKVHWSLGGPTDFTLTAGASLTLDRVYHDLPVGAMLLVRDTSWTSLVTVTASAVTQAEIRTSASQPVVVQSGPATMVTVDPPLPEFGNRRVVTVVELGDELPVADVDDAALGTEMWIAGTAATAADGTAAITVHAATLTPADLPDGRAVVAADAAGHAVATAVGGTCRIESAGAVGGGCFLAVPLTASADELAVLDPASLVLLGNAVAAGHGKTVAGEVVGSADARVPFQRFQLAKAPLSRVPSATTDGSTPALTLRVDGLAWAVAGDLLSAGPRDEVITLRTADDGKTIVQFGDGEHGERPASGTDNVTATYRFGAGLAGRVRAGTLTNAAAGPPGLRAVTNPVPGEGGADPEPAAQMRVRAPGTVRVFGRAVSARDYAELLLSTGAAAKAQSAQLWDGRGLVIAVTVAGAAGGLFSDASLATLAGADKAGSTPYRRVVVGNAVRVPVRVALSVAVRARADTGTVAAGVRAAVLAAFAFDALPLGGHLALSEIYRVTQPVTGVAAVTVTEFGFARPAGTGDADWAAFLAAHGDTGTATPERLRLLGVRYTGGRLAHAELATLADADLTVTVTSAPTASAGGLG